MSKVVRAFIVTVVFLLACVWLINTAWGNGKAHTCLQSHRESYTVTSYNVQTGKFFDTVKQVNVCDKRG